MAIFNPQGMAASGTNHPIPLYKQIYQMVRQIPPGQVATYGQIANLLGLYGRARQIGYALYRVDPDSDIPWHRVINAQGKISPSPSRHGSDELQRHLLEAEGVLFDRHDRIDLSAYRWQSPVSIAEEEWEGTIT